LASLTLNDGYLSSIYTVQTRETTTSGLTI
jgi:hypothetical protein